MEKLLFFGLTDAEFQKIKPVASRLKLHCEQIPVSRDRLLVMCQLPERRMDKLLFELRRIDAPIDYKAVLTPTNAGWTIPRLLMEMHSEKAAYTAKNR